MNGRSRKKDQAPEMVFPVCRVRNDVVRIKGAKAQTAEPRSGRPDRGCRRRRLWSAAAAPSRKGRLVNPAARMTVIINIIITIVFIKDNVMTIISVINILAVFFLYYYD